MSSPPYSETEDENVWRITMLELLSKVHTLGGITDLSFAVSESHYAVSGVNVSLLNYIIYTAAFI